MGLRLKEPVTCDADAVPKISDGRVPHQKYSFLSIVCIKYGCESDAFDLEDGFR